MPCVVKPEAFGIRQTAVILHVSEASVRNWIRSGKVKAFRVGPKLWRVPRSELARIRGAREA